MIGRLSRLRAPRILLIGLSTLLAIPAASALHGLLFPEKLDPTSIKRQSTYQDPALLARAWQLPVAATYQSRLFFQPNSSVCGPTSVANVLRSLGDESAAVGSVLTGSGECWGGVCWNGLSLDVLAQVARHATRRNVTVLRNLTLTEFQSELAQVNDPSKRYIVNFQRAPLFGKGGGHHSPIAGYLKDEDLVFVLDVNEDFRPWLVQSERLFRAVDTDDGGKKRGLLRIE